jgi:RNA polymerase sigma-70 factor, ECF subfamily
MQVTDQMFNDWVRHHHRLLFGIGYGWTGSRTDAESKEEVSFNEMRHEAESPLTLGADALVLHQSLEELEERHRLPVVLFYFQDLSYREIAEAL